MENFFFEPPFSGVRDFVFYFQLQNPVQGIGLIRIFSGIIPRPIAKLGKDKNCWFQLQFFLGGFGYCRHDFILRC